MLHNNFSTLVEDKPKRKKEKELEKHNLRKYLKEQEKIMGNLKVYNSKVKILTPHPSVYVAAVLSVVLLR